PGKVVTGLGLVTAALLFLASVKVYSLNASDWSSDVCSSDLFTELPSTGNTLTAADRFVPCDWAYRLLLPTPAVPTDNQYSVAPRSEERRVGKECTGQWAPGPGLGTRA